MRDGGAGAFSAGSSLQASASIHARTRDPNSGTHSGAPRHPDWIRVRLGAAGRNRRVDHLLRDLHVNTVCTEALCPNIGECWDSNTASIMILGDTCTRSCAFCAVQTGRPSWADPDEPRRVARAVARLGLDHVVVTSVTRDDLADGGAWIFAETVRHLQSACPHTRVELLIPDFNGIAGPLSTVVEAMPDILGHNVETVARLQRSIRRRARYDRSLAVLTAAKAMAARRGAVMYTKTSVMVGLGETMAELTETMRDIRSTGCDILAIGQYLRPSKRQVAVARYYHPLEFEQLKAEALGLGFRHVESGALVRSSYHARDQIPGGPRTASWAGSFR